MTETKATEKKAKEMTAAENKAQLLKDLKEQVKSGELKAEDLGKRTWYAEKFKDDFEANQVNGVWVTELESFKELGEAYSNKAMPDDSNAANCRQIVLAQGFTADASKGLIIIARS